MVSSLRNGELGLNREMETEGSRGRRVKAAERERDRGRVRKCTSVLREHYREMTSSVPKPVS